jgi:uncharacterized damage-inducible protein DinB
MPLPKKSAIAILLLALVVLLRPSSPGQAQEPAAAAPGVKGEMVFWIEDAEKKLTELAAATPESKYGWRPAKDARSTGEVFMHVASANYGIPGRAGVKPPEGIDLKTFEKSLTKKADIEKALADSFAYAKKTLAAATDADLNKPIDLFGRKTTFRGTYLLVLAHAHEHLGQSIAYARSNNITPPWTARREAAKKDTAKK